MTARLIRRGWLLRGFEVLLADGVHLVEYNGKGFGFEQVSVDGVVHRIASPFWFVPRFRFKLGGYPAVVDVRVWPWLSMRSLILRVGDRVLYAEGESGRNEGKVGMPYDWEDLV